MSENRYDGDNLTDYRIIQATPTVLTQLTPQQSASISLQARRYTSLDNRDEKVDSYGPNFGWAYQFHPRYNIQLSGGFLATKFKNFTNISEDWDYNPIYAVSLNYESEEQTANLNVTRTRQPFSNGADYDLTRVNANYRLQINPALSTSANASYEMTQDAEFSSNDLDEAWKAGIGISYAPTRNWQFNLSQNYEERQLLNGQDANRHIIKLGFTYNFGKTQ
jgi:predicted porin